MIMKIIVRNFRSLSTLPFRVTLLALVAIMIGPASVAFAHDGQPLAPHDIWSAWNGDLVVWLGLLLSVWAYGRGLAVLWHRPGVRHSLLGWRAASFVAGLGVLGLALISPLHALGSALFSAHMLQHVLLILVAAPLLSLGAPQGPFFLAIPWATRHQVGRVLREAAWLRSAQRILSQPVVVWGLHTLTIWVWHLPDFYQGALESEWFHSLEHLMFLGTGLLFWSVVWRAGHGLGVLSLFTLTLQSTLLSALITFAPWPWYSLYLTTTPLWNLTPLEDQQLAGVIMWIPAGFMYTFAALTLFMVWLTEIDQATRPST